MQLQQETFRVKGQEPVTRELRFTAHGPVLWSDDKRALVLKWVGAEPGTAGYLGSLALDRARNWTQFLDAMQRWKVPAATHENPAAQSPTPLGQFWPSPLEPGCKH